MEKNTKDKNRIRFSRLVQTVKNIQMWLNYLYRLDVMSAFEHQGALSMHR